MFSTAPAHFHLWALIVPTRLPIEQCLQVVERQIAHLPFEVSVIFNAYGEEVCRVLGGESTVEFTDEQLVQAIGGYVTHNHPGGSFFSAEDVLFAHSLDVIQVRAVARGRLTNGYTPVVHVLHRPDTGWDYDACDALYVEKMNRIQSDYGIPGVDFDDLPQESQAKSLQQEALLGAVLVKELHLPCEQKALYEAPKPIWFYVPQCGEEVVQRVHVFRAKALAESATCRCGAW